MDAMKRMTVRVPACAGLVGAPSDRYGGRVVAVGIDNFAAEVELTPWDGVSITPGDTDQASWPELADVLADSERYGYTGGRPLIQATLATFAAFVERTALGPVSGGFRIAYRSSIPRRLGLAGSSAIVVAVLRALAAHHGLEIQPALIASLAREAEERLGLSPGLAAPVSQTFGGVVAMDFRARRVRTEHDLDVGEYRLLDPAGLPAMYLAWTPDDAARGPWRDADIRSRIDARDWSVTSGMKMLAALAEQAEEAVRQGDHGALASLIDQSFDVRRKLTPLDPRQTEMVDRARAVGVSATFAGWAGAIVGTYRGLAQIDDLQARLESLGATVRRVDIAAEFGG